MSKKVVVIGAGFAGLSAATHLAQQGFDVEVVEKNEVPGGRARKFEAAGFTFDMGPSWYWMPEVFDEYFARFGKRRSDYYELVRLDPSYSIYFGEDDEMEVPAQREALYRMFEQYEPGSSQNLKKFLDEAAYKYKVGMQEFVHKPGNSVLEFADWRVVKSAFRLQMFQSMSSYVRKLFKNEQLIKLLEFPVLFLGATPQKTPALYSLMNYADLALGTWYPLGGMYQIIDAMVKLAEEMGVRFRLGTTVEKIEIRKDDQGTLVRKVMTDDGDIAADIVVGGADYHHIEQHLIEKQYRNYDEAYWQDRTMAPSSLLFYLGINRKLKLHHHTLFFDEDFNQHAQDIYEEPRWPEKPLFYACCPSQTDSSVAPEGCENLFLLIPLAPGLNDNEEIRQHYYNLVMDRLERLTGQQVRDAVVYKRSFAHREFEEDYNAFKGNAYGLANTLRQTAFLKPKLKSKKVDNLYFTGQLTTPGPGVPPSIISGQVVAGEIAKSVNP